MMEVSLVVLVVALIALAVFIWRKRMSAASKQKLREAGREFEDEARTLGREIEDKAREELAQRQRDAINKIREGA